MADPTTGAPDQEQPQATTAPDPASAQAQPDFYGTGPDADPETTRMTSGDPSAIFEGAKDVGRGIVHGAIAAVHETSQAIDDVATAGTKTIKRLGIPDVRIAGTDKDGHFKLVQLDYDPNTDASEGQAVVPSTDAFKPETSLGHLSANASQFLTGMALFGRAGGLMRSVGGKAAGEITKAGLSNAFSFDAHESMLADTLRNYPSIAQYASPFIMSNADDGEALARFKRGIEGLGMGAMGEAFIAGVRAFKAVKAGDAEGAVAASDDTQAALDKVQQEGMKPASEALAEDPNVQAAAQSNLRIKLGQIDDSVNMPRTTGETIPLVDGPRFDKPVDAQLEAAGDKPAPNAVRQPELPTTEVPKAPVLSTDALSEYRGKLARNEDWLANGGVLGNSIDTNFGRFPETADVRSTITALEEQVKASPGALDGVQSLGDVRKMANKISDAIGADPNDVLAYMGQDAKDIRTLGARITAYGDFYVSQSTKVSKLAQAVNERVPGQFGDMNTLLSEFEKQARILNETRTLYRSMSADTSRALGSYRVGLKVNENYAGLDFDNFGGEDDLVKMARAMSMSDGTASGLTSAMTASMPSRVIQQGNSMLVNSLLSLRTGVVKGSSDLFKLMITPVEKTLSGAYQTIGGAGYGLVQDGLQGAINGAAPGIARAREGLGMYASYGRFLFDALNSAGRAFKLGGQITDAAHGHMVPEGFGDGTVFSNLMDGNQGYALVNALTKYTTLPTRVIGTIDEFTKNLTYRAEVYRKAVADTSLNSNIVDKGAAIDARMNAAFGPQGQALDKDALNIARESTFSQDPIRDPNKLWGLTGSQSLTAHAMDLMNGMPILRQVQPFVKVPSNIARYAWTRTPGLNLLQKEFTSDLVAGGQRTSDALAKLTTGGAITAAGVYLANAGYVTGSLHPDPAVRRQIEDQTGVRHNSFVITHPDGTKDYVPLAQFADPIGPMLSAAADYARCSHYIEHGELMSLGSCFAGTVASGLEDKRYLQGLTNAIEAATGAMDPTLTKGERVKKFTSQLMAGYVPSMLANKGDDDPYMREVRGYLDGWMRKLPGSVGVDPHRNVLGEPVQTPPSLGPNDLSPFQRSHDDQDPINGEIARQLELGNSPLPRMPYKLGLPGKPGAVDLTQVKGPNGFSAYDRLQELMAQPPGKPSLREALTSRINNPDYVNELTDGDGQYPGSRRFEINKIIGAYQSAAKDSLLAESKQAAGTPYGDIFKQAVGDVQNRAAALKGLPLPFPEYVKKNAFKEAVAQP